MKPLTPKQLSGEFGRKLEALAKDVDRSIAWLDSARRTAPRLNMEADRLSIRLQRQRNKAGNLLGSVDKECAIGFFGLAQAGKSYLITALAASEKGKMELVFGSSVRKYSQLNPQQHNGTMVVRYSGQPVQVENEGEVQLSLLSEEELVAILVCLWARRNGDQSASLDEQQIAERLKMVSMYRQPQANDGMNSSDVIALWDRLSNGQPGGGKALETHFWPLAVELAPLLGVDDRARLFSLLWNEDRELTALYRQLAHVLHYLSCVPRVLAPISVLDDATQSILNCNVLRDFNASSDRVVQVVPHHDGRCLQPVNLTLAELTLLGREVLMPLYHTPRETLFEQVDLLDYPGVEEPDVLPDYPHHQLALAFISAKRPFLLTRAAERQDVSVLMVCSAVCRRSETRTVGHVLDNWVKQTQGENAQVRRGRKPGLIWTLTPFDQRITRGQCLDAAVQRYVGDLGDTWGTILAMDESGVRRIAGWLITELHYEAKIARLQEQSTEIRRELRDNLLGRWYLASEKEELQVRLRIAGTLLQSLQARSGVHGELMERLLPSRETLRHLFQQHQNPDERQLLEEFALSEEDPFGIGMSIDLLNDEPLSDRIITQQNGVSAETDAAFAQQIYRHWINTLQQLPDQRALLDLLGVSKPTLEMLTEELVTASIRLEIEASLVNILTDPQVLGTPPEMMADFQASRALSVMGDFVAWLGFQHLPEAERPESKINRGKKIFAKPESQTASLGPGQRLTRLDLKPNNYAAWYVYDWLVALNEMILQNEGYCAAREIDSKHREQLAAILTAVGH